MASPTPPICQRFLGKSLRSPPLNLPLTLHRRPLTAHAGFTTVLTFLVQLYFAAKLSTTLAGRSRIIILCVVITFCLLQVVMGSLVTYSLSGSDADIYAVALSSALGWQRLMQLVAGVVCDLTITVTLLVGTERPRWGSEGVLDVLTRWLCETNLVATVAAVVELALSAALPSTGLGLAVSMVTPKLLVLCMLACIARAGQDARGEGGTGNRSSSLTDFMRGPIFSDCKRGGFDTDGTNEQDDIKHNGNLSITHQPLRTFSLDPFAAPAYTGPAVPPANATKCLAIPSSSAFHQAPTDISASHYSDSSPAAGETVFQGADYGSLSYYGISGSEVAGAEVSGVGKLREGGMVREQAGSAF